MSISEHEHKADLIKPGNEEFLSFYKRQGDWKPTKPVGTIGALSSGPGPAIVNLPPTIGESGHDPRKTKAPAFKIAEKDTRQTFSDSPGPAFYDIRKKTNKGIDACHAPKIGENIKGFKPFEIPGPDAYHRGDSDKFIYRKSPSYTMRPKTQPMKGFTPPAPSSYTLPETLGPGRSPFKKSPAYTISERLDKTGIFQPNPGPSAYMLPPTNVNKPKAPAYSMRIKEKGCKHGPGTPGPASNYYHMVKYHKPATPRFTFGIRHSPYKAFIHFDAEK